MKIHTTNYFNTFIAIAADSVTTAGKIPPLKAGNPTIASLQYELISKNPYEFTSDALLFQVHAMRQDLLPSELKEAEQLFFSKGQACLRASPLTKKYGWGIHCNADGKIALYGCETEDYQQLLAHKDLKIVKAMNSSR